MKLSERLAQSAEAVAAVGPDTSAPRTSRARRTDVRKSTPTRTDPFADIKRRAHQALFDRLGAELYSSTHTEKELEKFVVQDLNRIIEAERIPLSAEEREALVAAVTNDVLGFGPIEEFLDDVEVTEIMVNGQERIFIERAGRLHETEAQFLTADHLYRVIDRIVAQVGRRIDEASPMVDARLADGSRVNAIIPPLALDGAALTIRKFSAARVRVEDLIRIGHAHARSSRSSSRPACAARRTSWSAAAPAPARRRCSTCCRRSSPNDERIITIEDAAELQLDQRAPDPPRGPPAEHRGQGRDPHPRPGPQRAAHAPRPHHRRRGAAAARPSTCSRR